MTELSIDTERQADTAIVAVSGDLDLGSVSTLRHESLAALADADVAKLVLDFAGLTFLDSTGLGCLVEIRQLAATSGKAFALRSVQPATARVLELGGLNGFFDVTPETGD